jgi:hypothetical protein
MISDKEKKQSINPVYLVFRFTIHMKPLSCGGDMDPVANALDFCD